MRKTMLALLLALAVPTAFATAPGEDAAERWQILIQGNPAGEMTRRAEAQDADPAGAELWTFTFNDRGRGPELETRLVLGEDGLPVSVATTGHDYFKVPVEERYSRATSDGETWASWKNANEAGKRELTEPALYLSYESAVPELALLARVSITGFVFTPVSVWLDEDGSFFGSAGGWFSTVPGGWDGVIETLREAEERADEAWARELAARLARRSPIRTPRRATRPPYAPPASGRRVRLAAPGMPQWPPNGAPRRTLRPGRNGVRSPRTDSI